MALSFKALNLLQGRVPLHVRQFPPCGQSLLPADPFLRLLTDTELFTLHPPVHQENQCTSYNFHHNTTMSCCYASRCLVDCCIVSWCCPCRWCCDLPQTYEETYEWQYYPDDLAKMERRYETMTLEQKALAKEQRRRDAAERARVRNANRRWSGAGRRMVRRSSSRSREDQQHREMTYSSNKNQQSRDDNDDWDHSVVMGGASTTSRSTAASRGSSGARRRKGCSGDGVTATRDLRDNATISSAADAGSRSMPDDPILSERSDYESQLSC